MKVELLLFFKKHKEKTKVEYNKVEYNIRDVVVDMPQSRDQLENIEGTNDEMSRCMWEKLRMRQIKPEWQKHKEKEEKRV